MDIVSKLGDDIAAMRSRREQLLAEVAHIETRLPVLENAYNVVLSYTKEGGEAGSREVTLPPAVLASSSKMTAEAKPRRGEQKRLIEDTLAYANPEHGMTVANIQAAILERQGIKVSPNTVSVTLARMRVDGKARLVGRWWFYGPDVDQKEMAEGALPGTPVSTEADNGKEV